EEEEEEEKKAEKIAASSPGRDENAPRPAPKRRTRRKRSRRQTPLVANVGRHPPNAGRSPPPNLNSRPADRSSLADVRKTRPAPLLRRRKSGKMEKSGRRGSASERSPFVLSPS
ncbi:MAG: hypothetical protein IIY07_08745, partial [Thermoguttaceae bacterium]|nr:hypothetical protein [Thermoguttaceae bacterium]